MDPGQGARGKPVVAEPEVLESTAASQGAAHRNRLVSYLMFPVLLGAFTGVIVVLVAVGFPVPRACLAGVILSYVVLAVLERFWTRVDGVQLLADPQAPRDLAHNLIVSRLGGPLASVAVVAVLGQLSSDGGTALVSWWPQQWPFVAQMACAWLIFSFFDYWMHRAYHSFDVLWWVHSVHHDINGLHILKAGRVHILEGMLGAAFVTMSLLVIGVPGDVLVAAATVTALLNNFSHANVDQRFWRPMHWFVQNIELHHIHHAVDRSLHDTNLGAPFFDVLFRTFTAPARDLSRPAIGLAVPGPTTLRGQLIEPFRHWFGRTSTAAPTAD